MDVSGRKLLNDVNLTPIGRALSVNEQVEAVHIQLPLIGSQNGVEQFAGTAEW
jgi:hypothetical protein